MRNLLCLLLAGLAPLGSSESVAQLPAELPDRCTTIAVAKLVRLAIAYVIRIRGVDVVLA